MDSNRANCSPHKRMSFPGLFHAFAARASLQCVPFRAKPLSSLRLRRFAMSRSGALVASAAVVFLCLVPPTDAQKQPRCQGPAALEKAIAEHPSAAAYDALGAHFAGRSQFSCAIAAFKSAVRMAPGSWQGHYNLGVALLTSGNAQEAADELKTALKLSPGSAQILLP